MIANTLIDSLKDTTKKIIQHPVVQSNTTNSFFQKILNYWIPAIGAISAVLGIYLFIAYLRTRKSQDYVYKLAEKLMEKDDVEGQLNQTKSELKSVEEKLSDIERQIKIELPKEAKKAVLKDRLNDSLESLTRYYQDVKNTKMQLEKLQIDLTKENEFLKTVEQEIEPKYLLKEKISTSKTYLTVISSLSSIAFVILRYPLGRIIGISLLMLGMPILIQIIWYSILRKSWDKNRMALLLKFGGVAISFTIFFLITLFVGGIAIFDNYNSDFPMIEFITAFGVASLVSLFFLIKLGQRANFRFFQRRFWSKGKAN